MSMDNISNCVRCGKLFKKVSSSICPECVKKRDEDFKKVKNYLYENRHASIEETVEMTGVEVLDIMSWLRSGQLVLHADSNITYPCEHCGAPIRSGKLCRPCSNEMRGAFDEHANMNRPRESRKGFYSKEVQE